MIARAVVNPTANRYAVAKAPHKPNGPEPLIVTHTTLRHCVEPALGTFNAC